VREVSRELARYGFYEHTPEELAYGARIAWRHHGRCIGRLFWRSLEVVDCRSVTHPDQIAGHLVDHLQSAYGDGRIRSRITIFAPVRGDRLPAYVESPQLVQYAGYADPQGRVIGDRQNVEQTRVAQALGWQTPASPGRFDVLPIMLREAAGGRRLYTLPEAAVHEVPIRHPSYADFDALGLRWYAVPCVSNMILTIGGIDYPCAPFNGFYMATEIASRDLADEQRHDLLPQVAASIGELPAGEGPPLWKDRALLELNRAVLHSFASARVTIVDHHAASEQYMEFVRRERAEGREPSGDWAWIVPPQASSACPVFHMPMQDLHQVPNYYHSRAADGEVLHASYGDEQRSAWQQRIDQWRLRWRRWQRRQFW
jgi:nitric-oxide synthase